MNLYSKQWCCIAFTVPLALASASLRAQTTTLPWEINANDYQGFYLYGQVGQATTDISRSELEDKLQDIDSSIESVWLEESDVGWSAGVGYFVNNWLSAELGWTDLGSRDVDLDESSSYPADGDSYYPQAGRGPSIGLVAHIPLPADFFIAPKMGIFIWEDDANINNDGTDLWYGAEISYRLDQDLSIFAGWQQFDLRRQDVDLYSIGLRYRFGKQSPAPLVKVEPVLAPVIVSTPVPTGSTIIDSDQDGVPDSLDKCPATAAIYQVDQQGCTAVKKQQLEHRLVIHYANDSAEIASRYDGEMAALIQFVQDNNLEHIYVEGHTSALGKQSYNQALSLRRAESVVKTLNQQYHLPAGTFIPIGKGESQLLDPALTPEANAANRRTEIWTSKVIETKILR